MHGPPPIPYTRPTPVTPGPHAQSPALAKQPVEGGANLAAAPRTDRLAIASAVCGLTAFVPVVSQLVGLVLGLLPADSRQASGRAVGGTAGRLRESQAAVRVSLAWDHGGSRGRRLIAIAHHECISAIAS